ncbi:Ulp1 protease family, C-terminal catalytic domain [Sesbania bispinosa]|nr:Ulp1 protease family, C-terminal catalytic domain [Sesbania bispinosa]
MSAYIFGCNKDDKVMGKETLIKSSWGYGERKALKSLMPKTFLDQEVLNSLASMLTYTERLTATNCTCWFLPTTVSQYALNWSKSPKKTVDNYKEDFMSNVEVVSKIFLPINDENLHWYLLVVDMKLHQLILLDSCPCPTRDEWRKMSARVVALYLEQMFLDDRFYDNPATPKPKITNFSIVQPSDLRAQISGSHDCGVFVAQWMKECIWTDDYKDIYVSDGKRMRLALDLVLKPYNEMKQMVTALAFKNMDHLAKERKGLVNID